MTALVGLGVATLRSASSLAPVIDIGLVVQDVERSAEFYGRVVGMKEINRFDLAVDDATRFGLARGQSAAVRVFILGESPAGATRLKMLSFPRTGPAARSDDIAAARGIRYLTINVVDFAALLARLKTANVVPCAPTHAPEPLKDGRVLVLVQDPDGNFIELIGVAK